MEDAVVLSAKIAIDRRMLLHTAPRMVRFCPASLDFHGPDESSGMTTLVRWAINHQEACEARMATAVELLWVV